jgi:hypothetical protein
VIQLVVGRAPPRLPVIAERCIADPEALVEIARRLDRADPEAGALADRFSAILHDLRIGGAWKRTNRGRLKRTEAMLCAHIEPGLRSGMTFLDLGASDGITTLEALHILRRAFGAAVGAVLADVSLFLLRFRRGPVVEYRAVDGEPVMARIGRFGLRLARPRHAQHAHNLLCRLYLESGWLRRAMQAETMIPLVHPLVRGEPGIAVLELDCLVREESLQNRFAAIRASNVLNLGYFSAAQLHQAVANLHLYLKDGGCLVVSRNHDHPDGEVENGSVWLKDGRGFRWVEDFGVGSEIKSVVEGSGQR